MKGKKKGEKNKGEVTNQKRQKEKIKNGLRFKE